MYDCYRYCSDPENFVTDSLDGLENYFDEFVGFEKKV